VFTGSAGFYDDLYGFRDYAGESARAIAIARRARGAPIRSVLDLGCATGDHAAALRRSGIEVVGVDVDAGLLRQARRKHRGIAFHAADILALDLGRTFDAVVSFYGVVAYARTAAGLRRFCRSVARHLAPGGAALIEPWHLRGHVFAPAARVVTTDQRAIARASVTVTRGATARVTVHYLVAAAGRVRHATETHRLGLFSRAEHLAAIREAGLRARWSAEAPGDRGAFVATRPE
jgi:SAM-dependent methyltransferase